MNQLNQYIFNLYHFILNFRDTMEYCLDRKHEVKVYESRKNVLNVNLNPGSALDNFCVNNGEIGQKAHDELKEFMDEIYSDESTVLKVAGDEVRVDHSQHEKIFEFVVQTGDKYRDILYSFINHSQQQNQYDPNVMKLVKDDERLYRLAVTMLMMHDFEKSFGEFQKAMAESQGKPTPQSNFIVQNELMKYSTLIRASRQRIRVTDNETLDLLDEVIEIIEMTEGRRDRRDNKSFKEFFDSINAKLNEAVAKAEPVWRASFDTCLKDALASQPKPAGEGEAQA